MKVLNYLKRHLAVITLIFTVAQLFALVGFIKAVGYASGNTMNLISNSYELRSLDTAIKSLDAGQDMPMKLLGHKNVAELKATYKEVESEIINSRSDIEKNNRSIIALVILLFFANAITGNFVVREVASRQRLNKLDNQIKL